MPLGIIGNISVQSSLLLGECICFWPVESICFQRQLSTGLPQNMEIGVREIRRIIKTYCFYSFMFKIEYLDLLKLAFW